MKLGFYYHIPVSRSDEGLFTAGALGCFLNELAKHVENLIIFMHEANSNDATMDYELTASNIIYVSLGRKPRAEIRTFLGGRLLAPIKDRLLLCDLMLIRGPTHLFGAWGSLCDRTGVKMIPFLVGDYRAGNANLPFSFPKKFIVCSLNSVVDWKERRFIRNRTVFVNSCALAEKYKSIAAHIHEVRTTTLSEKSFFERKDTCEGKVINLLYTGRYDWQKGLQELFDAFTALVKKRGLDVKLNFVGWQDGNGPSIEGAITRQAKVVGLSDRVIFHGMKTVGPELDALYRKADIYVLPSYAEGFPRTIWEAMANSCPVVATQVGAIPTFLKSGQHALLVSPGSVKALLRALITVIENKELRQRMIFSGMSLARANTLEDRTRDLITAIGKV